MDTSFGIWDQDSAFRQFVYVFMANKWVESSILICILVQTVFMGLAIPGDQEKLQQGPFPHLHDVTKHMDNVFLIVYIVEMALRMIALGVSKGKHSYCKSNWNLLDGFLVVMSVTHVLAGFLAVDSRDSMATHPSTNGIRIIRCLRPLRTAGFVKGVKSALDAWDFLINIGILLLFSTTMFGVMGVQLFGGVFSFDCASDFDAAEIRNFNVTSCPMMVSCDNHLCVSIPKEDRGVFAYWGYDNIGQSLLTGWIATTGDMYSPNMITNLSTSNALYSGAAWWFCIAMVLFLQLIVAHLFSAVVVHAFLQDAGVAQDAAAIEHRIARQKQVFMRIDHDHSGTIETSELWSVTTILGLQDLVSFSEAEIDDAISALDPNGDGDVDFEEFSHFWSENGAFVVKLKKALKVQEEGIRKVWVQVDVDSDNNLGVRELEQLGMHLGIKLSDADTAIMIEEMDARIHGVNYKLFCKWWFSDSRIAAKVKRASLKKNDGPIKMFRRMDRDKDGWITIDDIFDLARVIFGHPLSIAEAAEIMEDCLQRESTTSVNSSDVGRMMGKVSLPVFESWWVSTKPSATEMRHKRQTDVAETQTIMQKFDIGVGGDGDGDLNQEELQNMCQKLDLKDITGQKIMESIAISNAVVQDTHFESFDMLANAELQEAHRQVVKFDEFFDWMRSAETLAEDVKKAFQRAIEKEARSQDRPFLFIPYISPLCREITFSERFDKAMTMVIIVSTAFIATEFHEMAITHPTVFDITEKSRSVFSCIYLVEFMIKLLGLGIVPYFKDLGNRFDFMTVSLFIGGFFVPSIRKATAFRGLRVLVKSLRVMRAARIIAQNEAVMTLLKTILESGQMLVMLSAFACFMLVVLTIVAGHTLGTCHLTAEGLIDPDVYETLPKLNFYRFSDGFHSNFLIMMGESWAPIMFHYQDCTKEAWVYFVISYCVMNFFIANLFVALIVDGFCLTAEEKMIKQEKHHLEAVAAEGGIMKSFAGIDEAFSSGTALAGGALDALKGSKGAAFGAVKDLPKPQDVMKNMSRGARTQKLTGPLASMKNEMGRRLPVDLDQMASLKAKADARVKAARDEVTKHAELTMKKAQDAADLAAKKAVETAKTVGEAGASKAREAQELAQALAEEKIEEAKRKMEERLAEFNGEDLELAEFDTMTPEEKKKMSSWNFFMVDNKLRRRCIWCIENPNWENMVIVIIMMSSVLIAVDGPPGAKSILDGNPEDIKHRLRILNGIFLGIFTIEFSVKTIADGFYSTPKPYWDDHWNKMDCITLLVSTFEFFMAGGDDSPGIARIIRVLRLMRPLRLMKSNESMQVLIDTMKNVVPIMMGVLGLMLIFFTTFAIFGMGLFMGKFYSCNCDGKFGLPVMNCTDLDYKGLNMTACLDQGGSWENPPYNFDDFFAGLRTLYFCSNGGGWIDIIQSGMDVTDVYEAPERGNSSLNVTYFWFFIIFNRLFVVNVFIGILTNFFLEANGAALLTDPQTAWAQCQIFCLWETSYMRETPPKGSIKRWIDDGLTSKWSEPTITSMLAVSVISMLYESNVRMTDDLVGVLFYIEWITLYFFTSEVIARLITYGRAAYWKDTWCRIDAFIVVCTWMSTYQHTYHELGVLRGVRILRLLLLARKVNGLRTLTRTLLVSIPGCFNVVVLLGLFVCIFAVCAMNLFGGIGQDHDTITEFDNFDNFFNSFAYLVQMCIAGQDFVNVIYELDNLNQPGAFFFFTLYNLVTQWLIINMIVVVLVDNFMKSFIISTMDIQDQHVKQFKQVWCRGKTDPGGIFWGEPFTQGPKHPTIHVKMLEEFVPQLLPPTESLDVSFQAPSVHAFLNEQLHHHSDDSPLGVIVPHVIKHKGSLAAPYATGQLAHVDGALVEIIGRRWNNGMTDEQAKAKNIPPDHIEVNFIESAEMDATRVVSPEGLHVPPVERFKGFLDGVKPVTITWVSKDRNRVRVQFGETMKHKKTKANVKLKNIKGKDPMGWSSDDDAPSWMRRSQDLTDEEVFNEQYYTPQEEKEREAAAAKIQAVQRGRTTRKRLKRERRAFILARRAEQQLEAENARIEAEKNVLFVLEVKKRAAIKVDCDMKSEQIGWLELGELVDSYECQTTPDGIIRHRIIVTRTIDKDGALSPRSPTKSPLVSRGKPTRLEGWASEKSIEGVAILQRRGDKNVAKRFSVDEHGTFDEYPATSVMKVTPAGDEQWLNRLGLELGITQQEMNDGFRYLPEDTNLVDEKGRFMQCVVGLRALPDGTFVQDIELGFHELLLALCLINSSYDGLNFNEQQEKVRVMQGRMQDYAARVMQCCARSKFAKRHLLRAPVHMRDEMSRSFNPLFKELEGLSMKMLNKRVETAGIDADAIETAMASDAPKLQLIALLLDKPGPLMAWERYHKRFGHLENFDDPLAGPKIHFLEAARATCLSAMKNCFAIKAQQM